MVLLSCLELLLLLRCFELDECDEREEECFELEEVLLRDLS